MEPTLRNPARERLEAGELALGVGIRQSRTVDIASIMKACGYDWLFLDSLLIGTSDLWMELGIPGQFGGRAHRRRLPHRRRGLQCTWEVRRDGRRLRREP